MPRILILCPTHDHADTLFCSIASVRAQTITDWEMVVIGDGPPPRTAEVMSAIMADEPRVTYIEKLKGARYGEAYRDPVIRASDADIVCHLSDDDLWAANHLEAMCALLERADWGAQAELRMGIQGRCVWLPFHHGPRKNRYRRVLTSGLNYVAYRRSAYLGLREGWTPAPEEFGSDRYMWQKFLRKRKLAVASSADSTVLKLPSRRERAGLTPDERVAELTPWLKQVNVPGRMVRLRRNATIAARTVAMFRRYDAHLEGSWQEALRKCGLQVVSADAPCAVAIDEDAMDLPLTRRQRREVRAVFGIGKATHAPSRTPGGFEGWRDVLGDDRSLWISVIRAFSNVDADTTRLVTKSYVDRFGTAPEQLGQIGSE